MWGRAIEWPKCSIGAMFDHELDLDRNRVRLGDLVEEFGEFVIEIRSPLG